MGLLENADLAVEGQRGSRAAERSPQSQGTMESRTHCAYNQTRECFLGLEVRAADLTPARVGEMMLSRPLKSGEGVWMMPYRGIPASAVPAPLDLIYLDQDRRVIDTVESFPTFQVSSSSPRPESVLALPAHSIYSSQTQPGDQLVLCFAEEMEHQLERLTSADGGVEAAETIEGAVLLREKPLWSGGPGLLELENRSGNGHHGTGPTYQMDLAQPGGRNPRPPRNWLERWWSPDPRKAPRIPVQGLAAYYWNGSAPVAHSVRDLSSSGLYVITEERWYPGTLVLMTLQRADFGDEMAERSISVQSRAVRWGPDGVGLQFILHDKKDKQTGNTPNLDAADRKDFDRFLGQLKKSK
jgi:uncharacterized membrane protein (UPF0127 family)